MSHYGMTKEKLMTAMEVPNTLDENGHQHPYVALEVLRRVRTVYVDVPGASDVTVLKIAKQEVRALICSPRWMKGYHLMLRPDLGRAALLSACNNHKECGR